MKPLTRHDLLLADELEERTHAFERQEVEVARAMRDKDRAVAAHAVLVEREEVALAVLLRRLYRADPKRCLSSPAFLEQLAETVASEPRAEALKTIVNEVLQDLAAQGRSN